MLKKILVRFINLIFSPLLNSIKTKDKERCINTIKNKLSREDITEISLIMQTSFTQERFNKVKQAIEKNTLNEITHDNIDYYTDVMWIYQVILSDNAVYILIFDDVYQDVNEKPKEYMALRYFHTLKTPIEVDKNHIIYKLSL